jgi:type II secretory pathway component HofQ
VALQQGPHAIARTEHAWVLLQQQEASQVYTKNARRDATSDPVDMQVIALLVTHQVRRPSLVSALPASTLTRCNLQTTMAPTTSRMYL